MPTLHVETFKAPPLKFNLNPGDGVASNAESGEQNQIFNTKHKGTKTAKRIRGSGKEGDGAKVGEPELPVRNRSDSFSIFMADTGGRARAGDSFRGRPLSTCCDSAPFPSKNSPLCVLRFFETFVLKFLS